jgi:hypothetical protein
MQKQHHHHNRFDGISPFAEFRVLTVGRKKGDKSMLLIQRPCLGKNKMP